MKRSVGFKMIRAGMLLICLTTLPLDMIAFAQTPTATPYTSVRTETHGDNGSNWGWLGLLGLAGLLGLLRRRETNDRGRTTDTTGRSNY